MIKYGFDFFNNEKVNYIGVIDKPEDMAELMRNNDVLLFPSFADACPQTVIEAINCGLKVEMVNDVGGTKELIKLPLEMLSLEYMGNAYKEELERL